MQTASPRGSTRLNHVEFLHRPGEEGLAIQLFEALQCQIEQVDVPPYGKYIVVRMAEDPGQNDFFASEAEAEQLALERALQREMDSGGSDVAAGFAGYRRLLEERPFRSSHVGIRLPDVAVYDRVIESLEALGSGKLAGRLTLGHSIERSVAEAGGELPVKQVWAWTDVISTGLLSTGQLIEIQTYSA